MIDLGLVLLLLMTAAIVLPALSIKQSVGASQWQSYTATPSDAFLNTVGVATHKNYSDTSYGKLDLLALLRRLNVRNIRDAAIASSLPFYRDFVESAGAGAGVSYIVDTRNPGTVDDQIKMIASQAPGTASQIESQNEPDCKDWSDARAMTYRQQAKAMRATMNQLEPLRTVPLTTPSFCRTTQYSYSTYGDDGVSQRFNMHPYAGGLPPGEQIDEALKWARAADPNATPVVSESGYHNAVNSTDDHQPVSELAEAVYLPQMLLEYRQRGIVLTCTYELLDERPNPARDNDQQNFGLFRVDGSIKPAGASMAALLATLSDESGGNVKSQVVDLAVSGSGQALRVLPFVRSDGSIDVALWHAQAVWDPETRSDLPNPSVEVVVQTRTPAAGSYVRIDGVEKPGRTQLGMGRQFSVPVSSAITILRLSR